MSSADVLIIYLAAGTPFGVYSLLDLQGRFSPRSLIHVALKFLVWPFFAGLSVYHFVTGPNLDPQEVASIERSIAQIRSELMSISTFDSQRNDLRQLLSAFDTYTGLAEMAAYSNGIRLETPALLEPVEHPAPLIAARCIGRRNRALLESHCVRAEHELRAEAMRFEKKFGIETNVTRLVDTAVELFINSPSPKDSQLGVYSEDGILSTA